MTDSTKFEINTFRNAMNNRFIEYVCEWRKEHSDEYYEFRKGADAAADGDYSTFEKVFDIAVTCVPHALVNECLKFFGHQPVEDNGTTDEYDVTEEELQELLSLEGYFKLWYEDGKIDADIVAEKEEPQPQDTWYYRIKGTDEWWQSVPSQYKLTAVIMTQKSEKELKAGARRMLVLAYAYLPQIAGKLYTLAFEQKNPILLSGLYYVMIDHGLRNVVRNIGGMPAAFKQITSMYMFVKSAIGKLTKDSISQGYDSKSDWKNDFKNFEDPELRREVMQTIEETPGRKGRPHLEQEEFCIDDYLIANDKEALKKQIQTALGEMQHDYDLAFIREALRRSHHLTDVSYPLFHHAICALADREYKYDQAQRMASLIEFRAAAFEASRDPRNLRGKRLIGQWRGMFAEVE